MRFSAWIFLDVVILIFGIYQIIICSQMRKSGKINKSIRNRSNTLGRPCRDEKGYIEAITKSGMILGVSAVVTGVYDFISDLTGFLPIIKLLMTVAFLLIAYWYFRSVNTATKKYF